MTDRPSVFQKVQLGLESEYGSAVAGDIAPQSFGIVPRIRSEAEGFRPPGYFYRTLTMQGREWSEFTLNGHADYNELVYLLASLLVQPSPTGASDAKTWLFEPAVSGGDTQASYTLEHGDSNIDAEFPGVMCTALTLELTRRGFGLQGTLLGQDIDTSGGLTAAITPLAPRPIEPRNADVYIDDAGADLGTTQLERVLRVRWQFGDAKSPLWPLLSSAGSFAALLESEPTAQLALLVQADATGMGYLTNVRSGDTLFVRVAGTSDAVAEAGEPNTYYSFQFDTAFQIDDISEFRDEQGVYAVEYTGGIAYDGTWEKAISWQLVNTLASL